MCAHVSFEFFHFAPCLGESSDGEMVETPDHCQESVEGMEVKKVLGGRERGKEGGREGGGPRVSMVERHIPLGQ